MFERFTEPARKVVVFAQEEARILKHNFIGTEHLLLGLLREGEGIGAWVLRELGLKVEAVRGEVARMVGSGETLTSGQIPFTPEAKKALELSLREALALGHNYIGTEHLLLGLVRGNEGPAAEILLDLGADSETVRDGVITMLAGGAGPAGAPALERIGLPDTLLDGAVCPLRELIDQLEERLGRPPDAGDLLLVLASVPEGLTGRSLATLGVDRDALAQAIDQARRDGRHSALLLPTDVLVEYEEVRSQRATAFKARKYREAAALHNRERELLEGAKEPILRRCEKLVADLWALLEKTTRHG